MSKRLLYCALSIVVIVSMSGCVHPFIRHVAEFRFGPEQLTNQTATGIGTGGIPVYTKTFNLPANRHTLFITLSSTGDGHGGAAHWFSASVNGVVCNKGNEGAGFAPGGWIPLQKHRNSTPGGDGGGGIGDLHDNGIYYTWCCTDGLKPGGPNTVQIRMASSIQGQIVFMERSHFYIDSCNTRLCNPAGPPAGEGMAEEAPSIELPPGHEHPRQEKPPL